MSMFLSQISIFPIKSTQGLRVSRSDVESYGLSFDRRFMLADSKGRMLTGRALPKLVQVKAVPVRDGLRVCHPESADLLLRYDDFAHGGMATHVWKDEFEGLRTTDEADHWFSELLGRQCHLLYCGQTSVRFGAKAGVPLSFADGFPLLLISQASLEELNRRSAVASEMAQFRPNLVVSGTAPFAEDGWQRIRIGQVEFKLDCPCSRCIFTTRDPLTGDFLPDKEPLATLSKFRKDATGKINFGMNLIALNEGMIEEGMPIEVLQTRTAEVYKES